MLMVILGAGASFDSAPSAPPANKQFDNIRMPLADSLFESRDWFSNIMNTYSMMIPIVPKLRAAGTSKTVEKVLEEYQAASRGDPAAHQQLVAVRFYLQHMIRECQDRWTSQVSYGITNYAALFDRIRVLDGLREPVCLVTFNYDTMIESALAFSYPPIKEMSDYVSGQQFKLFKLHGSTDWGRKINHSFLSGPQSDKEFAEKIGRLTPPIPLTGVYYRTTSHYEGDYPLFPAIAIPVQTKLESDFECPTDHLAYLKSFLPKITKILIIGWRAAEDHFFKMVSEAVKHRIRVMAVCGETKEADATLDRLRKHIDLEGFAMPGGFTKFINDDEGESFLRN